MQFGVPTEDGAMGCVFCPTVAGRLRGDVGGLATYYSDGVADAANLSGRLELSKENVTMWGDAAAHAHSTK